MAFSAVVCRPAGCADGSLFSIFSLPPRDFPDDMLIIIVIPADGRVAGQLLDSPVPHDLCSSRRRRTGVRLGVSGVRTLMSLFWLLVFSARARLPKADSTRRSTLRRRLPLPVTPGHLGRHTVVEAM